MTDANQNENSRPVVLITGIAGFIGMHTANRFLKENWRVIGIDNLNDYYSPELKQDRIQALKVENGHRLENLELHFDDINSSVWNHFKEKHIDVIIHLAAQAGVRYSLINPNAYIHSNVVGFQRVIEFALEKPEAKFLYASSSSVYGKTSKIPFSESLPCDEPESFYATTKRFNELCAQTYFKTHGLTSIGMRFFTVYGPWGRPDMAPMLFCEAAHRNAEIDVYNYGNQSRDFTYISDIVEGIYRLSINPKRNEAGIVNVGNGRPVKLLDFITEIERSVGKKLRKNLVPAQIGDVEQTYADTSLLFSITGRKPQVPIDDGIARFVKWFSQYYGK